MWLVKHKDCNTAGTIALDISILTAWITQQRRLHLHTHITVFFRLRARPLLVCSHQLWQILLFSSAQLDQRRAILLSSSTQIDQHGPVLLSSSTQIEQHRPTLLSSSTQTDQYRPTHRPTYVLSLFSSMLPYVHRDHKDFQRRGTQDGHLDFHAALSSASSSSM